MSVDLIYKHQQKTYALMNEALEKNGRAAYVYPTGCGKSFPTLKYIEDNPNKSATIVVPSNFIKKQYEKNIKRYVERGADRLENKNIKIVTYQNRNSKYKGKLKSIRDKFNKIGRESIILDKKFSLSKKFIPQLDSDIVVFDEIHRMGAAEWEKAVDRILVDNPKRKVIGMSATPERTDKRNMAYEKFGDSVVYEMSLTEALSGEKEGEVLLKSPAYVRVISLLKTELSKYKVQMDLLEEGEKKERYIKAYQRLDTIVSNSPDIQDVIAAGIKNKNGKYIVFCKDREDLFDKIEHVNEIFGKVNSKINVDYVITKKNDQEDIKGKTKFENDRTLEEFESRENGDGLNLLFCVDMLNEGVHLEGIDGEVLFDLTKSPILYKQRIGRVLSADKNAGDAVIIDAANNWLTQIETYREIERAIQTGQQRGKEEYNEERNWDLLKLLPEEVELLEVLSEIGEALKYGNKFELEKLVEWLKNHDGEMPRGNIFRDNARVNVGEMTSEEKEEVSIRWSWNTSEERKILKKYELKELEEIPEEDREMVEKLRSFGLGMKQLNAYKQFVCWLEVHDGKLPRLNLAKKGKRIPVAQRKGEEKDEEQIRTNWESSQFKKILEKYSKNILEEVPEEYREKIKTLRSYGLGLYEKTVYEQLVEWLETHNGEMPRGHIYIEVGKELKIDQMTEEQQKEVRLRHRWNEAEERKVLEKYKEKELEEIPEEYREKVKTLRFYGLGLDTFKKFIKWLEEHAGKIPRAVIEENGVRKKLDEMTPEEKEEVSLRRKWYSSAERKSLIEYQGKEIDEIPKEYREKIRILRSYDIHNQTNEAIRIRMRKAVGKEIKYNEEIRRELEEETKEQIILEDSENEFLNK